MIKLNTYGYVDSEYTYQNINEIEKLSLMNLSVKKMNHDDQKDKIDDRIII